MGQKVFTLPYGLEMMITGDCNTMNDSKKTVIALGMFDGVHIGHKKLVDTAVLIAKSRGLIPCVYTFSNHPQEFIGNSIARLCTNEARCEYLHNLGVERIEMVEFTSRIRGSSPKNFVDELIWLMNPAVIVAGFNYTFGVKKSGNAEILQKLALAQGVDAAIVQPVLVGKQPVSSTRIRKLIEKGDVQQAQLLLGKTHNIPGVVVESSEVHGGCINRVEPNATIILPKNGAYICFAEFDNCLHPAIAYVEQNTKKICLVLTNSIENLTDKNLTVRFIRSIRMDNVSDVSDTQLAADRVAVQEYFGAF